MNTLEFLSTKIHACLDIHEELRQRLNECGDEDERKKIENQIERLLIEIEALESYKIEIKEFYPDVLEELVDRAEEEALTEKDFDDMLNDPRMKNKGYRKVLMGVLIDEERFEDCKKLQEFEDELENNWN